MNEKPRARLPGRWELPSWLSSLLFAAFVIFFAWSLSAAGISVPQLLRGLPNMATIAKDMMPPATDRALPMMSALLVTFQMALVGTVIGIILSLPLAVLMARNYTPHPAVRTAVRGAVSFIRTVPDLAWALFFVASVGLGPFAGTLTLIMDTVGFCARFFDEVDEGPARGPNGHGRIAHGHYCLRRPTDVAAQSDKQQPVFL